MTGTYIPYGDYRSVVIAEITGVSAQPFLAHASSIVNTPGAGTDNIGSGSFTVSVVPAIVIAISSNESQVHGPPYAPAAGTGFTSLGTVTNYGMGNDFGRLTYAVITTTGTQQALFSALGADEYLTFAVVFH